MIYEDQLKNQRARARALIDCGAARSLDLVRVEYPGTPPRVSVIGHAISRAAIEVWREGGAEVTLIESVDGGAQ